ncbi:DUF742 domain-containing protein [Streptomyces sp. NK08204]|uniref:DUF742 domain-containing protein n=1 Tax=Streptomyces sp. NK08204 TaxID=2873260 RepID=UPI0035A8EB7C
MADGHTRPGPAGMRFGLVALVTRDPAAPGTGDGAALGPEHRGPIEPCRPQTQSAAEPATDADLPVGAVRVLTCATSWNWAARPSAAWRPRPPAGPRTPRAVIQGSRAV